MTEAVGKELKATHTLKLQEFCKSKNITFVQCLIVRYRKARSQNGIECCDVVQREIYNTNFERGKKTNKNKLVPLL